MREVSWRAKCPGIVIIRLRQVATSNLLLVQENGPTSFVLKDERQTKIRVSIGSRHSCNCQQSKEDLSCVHVLWVLAKLFRLPHDNPLLWQHSFLEAEIEQVVSGRNRLRKQRINGGASQQRGGLGSDGDDPNAVPRKPLEDDSSCPICCDDMDDVDLQRNNLVYCRYGCGNNIHVSCFKQYAVHNATNPQPLACPLCRNKWGTLDLPTPITMGKVNMLKRQQATAGLGLPAGGVCSSCKLGFATPEIYKCAFCVEFQLCTGCFMNPLIHPHHPFDVSVDGSEYVEATRPRAQPPALSTRLTTAAGGGDQANPPPPPPQLLDPNDPRQAMLHRDLGPEDYEMLLQLDEGTSNAQGSTTQVLSAEEVRRLRGRTIFTGNVDQIGGYDACVVCLDKFQAQEAVIVLAVCGHVFHEDCLATWALQSKAVCPIDNIPLVVPPPPAGGGGGASLPPQPTLNSAPPPSSSTALSRTSQGPADGRSASVDRGGDLGVVGSSTTVTRSAGRQPGASSRGGAASGQRPPANKRRTNNQQPSHGSGGGMDLSSLLTSTSITSISGVVAGSGTPGGGVSRGGPGSPLVSGTRMTSGSRVVPTRPAAGRPPISIHTSGGGGGGGGGGTGVMVGSGLGLTPVLGVGNQFSGDSAGVDVGTPTGAPNNSSRAAPRSSSGPSSVGVSRSRSSSNLNSRQNRRTTNRVPSSGGGVGVGTATQSQPRGGQHQDYTPSASDLAELTVNPAPSGGPSTTPFQFQFQGGGTPTYSASSRVAPMSRPLAQGRLR